MTLIAMALAGLLLMRQFLSQRELLGAQQQVRYQAQVIESSRDVLSVLDLDGTVRLVSTLRRRLDRVRRERTDRASLRGVRPPRRPAGSGRRDAGGAAGRGDAAHSQSNDREGRQPSSLGGHGRPGTRERRRADIPGLELARRHRAGRARGAASAGAEDGGDRTARRRRRPRLQQPAAPSIQRLFRAGAASGRHARDDHSPTIGERDRGAADKRREPDRAAARLQPPADADPGDARPARCRRRASSRCCSG